MKKRILLALLITMMVAGGAFAQMSLGLGGTFGANFQNWQLTDDGKKWAGDDADAFDNNIVGGGFFAYFDATYVMASLGMNFYSIEPANSDAKKAQDDAKVKNSLTTFDIEVIGKFPIDLGSFTLFPMLGVDIRLPLAQDMEVDGKVYAYDSDERKAIRKLQDDDEGSLADLTQIWIKVGIGADIPLGEKVYLRPMFLYGIGTNDETQNKTLTADGASDFVTGIINHGLEFKLALGFKL